MSPLFQRYISNPLLGLAVLCAANAAPAAVLRAEGGSGTIRVGETRSVSLVLDLSPGEQASVFEGSFQLSGADVADAELLTNLSQNWSSAFGKLTTSGTVKLSLTSNNGGGSRVVGTLRLTGKRLGNLSLQLQGPNIVAEDTAAAPYTRAVSLSTPIGATLASINVVGDVAGVPAPSVTATWLAVLCGALSLAGLARLRRRASVS